MTTEREWKQTWGQLWHGGGKMLSYENLLFRPMASSIMYNNAY